jgi:vancomycin resistance protein YoaR
VRAPRLAGLLIGLSALGGAAAASLPLLSARLPEPRVSTFAGRVVPEDQPLSSWLARRAEVEARQEVVLTGGDAPETTTREALGLSLDVDAARAALTEPLPRASLLERVRHALADAPPEARDVQPEFRFDARKGSAWLERAAKRLRREPVDARIELAQHRRIEARSGRELDLGTSLARLSALGAGDEVELAFTELEPAVTSAAQIDVDPSLVLSSYETDFAKRGGPRVHNIRRAAKLLDGALLLPGEVWSFNRTVGPRTLERGFIDAPVIVADEFEKGVGGGVCQVASTLFAAAVLGGLDIVQRRSHSRPSGYAPLGLDAVVIDGEQDLKLRNPYAATLIVHATLSTPTRVRVELLGASAPGKIEHSFAVLKSDDFYRRVAQRPELLPDQVKRQQEGNPGYEVVSTVRTTSLDGSRKTRQYKSTYYPVPEVYWIGSAVDPASLPALPERATHTVFAGEASELEAEVEPTTPAGFTSGAALD